MGNGAVGFATAWTGAARSNRRSVACVHDVNFFVIVIGARQFGASYFGATK
jgi:hypothetical protein